MGDGDGWVTCSLGHRHWGRYGAAGLLIRTSEAVVLQHRAPWSHHGDTWGVPGGARDSGESACTAALREAAEEAGVGPESVRIAGVHLEDHGGWTYATVLAAPVGDLAPRAANAESVDVGWHLVGDVAGLPLHPGFALSWPVLRLVPPPPMLVVDAANVVGSRPDGWWRDRPGAAGRLYDGLCGLSVRPADLPAGVPTGPLAVVYPGIVMVLEGAARAMPTTSGARRVDVVRAHGSGDDAIVEVVTAAYGPVLVVTADRELGRRVRERGATVLGPAWLWAVLASTAGEP